MGEGTHAAEERRLRHAARTRLCANAAWDVLLGSTQPCSMHAIMRKTRRGTSVVSGLRRRLSQAARTRLCANAAWDVPWEPTPRVCHTPTHSQYWEDTK